MTIYSQTYTTIIEPAPRDRLTGRTAAGNGWRTIASRGGAALAAVVAIGSKRHVGPSGLRVRVWRGEVQSAVGAGEPDLTVSLRPGTYTAAEIRAAAREAAEAATA